MSGVLSDKAILLEMASNRLEISPFNHSQLSAASYDIRLSDEWFAMMMTEGEVFDFKNAYLLKTKVFKANSIILNPGQVVNALSYEWVTLPNDIGARIQAKSTIGRIHLAVTTDAGWFDPGFPGRAVLEIRNNNQFPIKVPAYLRCAQFVFERVETPATATYHGNYVGQGGFLTQKFIKNLVNLGEESERWNQPERTDNSVS